MSASRPARVKTNVQDRLVRGQLDKILSSNVFARTERLRNFLRFIVKESLQGRADSLKEQVLACEIYGRGADFEAAIDPVVRVDARRLRDKLREYYSEFPNDPLIISLPKGGYAPAFERNPDSIGVVQEIHREKPAPSSAPGSADQQPKPTQVRRIALAVAAVGEAGTSGAAPGPSLTQVQRSQRWHRIAVGSSALVVVAIAIIFAMWLRSPETMPPPRPVRFAFTPGTNVADLVISPDGRHIAYIGGDEETKLWVQDLDQQEPRELGAASSSGYSTLFWSPDSDFIGFVVGGELKKIPVRGGPATLLCRLPGPNFLGRAWSPDRDTIVFTAGQPLSLYKVASAGVTPELLIKGRPNEVIPVTPHFLPREHGKRLLLVGDLARGVVLYNLDTGEEEILFGALPGGLFYSPSVHVLQQRGMQGPSSRVSAMPVSTDKLTPTGGLFLVAESASYPSASVDGTLVYLDQSGRGRQLVWRDRSGNKLGLIGQSQPFMYHPELSPDGRRVAVRAWDADSWNLWVHDVDRPLKTRLTFEERLDQGINPLWSLSGSQIFFLGLVEDQEGQEILSIPADGSGKARALIPSYPDGRPLDWSPDEKYLLVNVFGSNRAGDIEYLERKDDNGSYEVVAFLKDPFDERAARFSRDGRFVAYSSNDSGRKEVYVRRFPDGGGKRQVSESGGMKPRWSRNGKELFYFDGDWLVVIPITTSPTFSVGSPRRLFRSAGLKEGFDTYAYDVSADGKRFVIAEPVEDAPPPTIRVVQNWVEPSTTSSDSGHHNEPRHAAPSRRLEGLTRLSVPTASRFGPQEPSIWPSK